MISLVDRLSRRAAEELRDLDTSAAVVERRVPPELLPLVVDVDAELKAKRSIGWEVRGGEKQFFLPHG